MNKGISPLVFAGMLAAILLAGVVFVVRSVAQDTGSIDAAAAKALSDYGAANVASAAAEALPTFAAPSQDPIVTVYALPTPQIVTVDLPTPTPTVTATPTPTLTPWPTPTPAPPRWRTEYRGEWKYIELPFGWMPCYVWGVTVEGRAEVSHQDYAWYFVGINEADKMAMLSECMR